MIDQRFCKYIKTIAQYHSFSKAAQVLYVSQPALSRFVKKVEDELGVTLFDRDTIPLRLTLAGQRYLEYVEQFQGLERNMRQEFSAMGKQSFNRYPPSPGHLCSATHRTGFCGAISFCGSENRRMLQC